MKTASNSLEPKRQKAFRNKYLAAFFAVAALLISSVVSAQTDSLKYSQINGYGFKYKRHVQDSVSIIPLSTSPHTPYRAGGIRYRASDSTLQLWTGYQWNSILTGVGNGIDTAYMLNDTILAIETPDEDYFIQVGKRHVDSIYRKPGQDSTFYTIAGVERAIKDSSGTTVILTNIGSGYRLVATSTGNIKTLVNGYGILADSTTNANAITVSADTSSTNHLVTQSDLNAAIRTDFAPLNTVDTSKTYEPVIILAGESNPAGVISDGNLVHSDSLTDARVQILNNLSLVVEPLAMGINNNLLVATPAPPAATHGMELKIKKRFQAGAFKSDTIFIVKIAYSGAQIGTLINFLDTAYKRLDTAFAQIKARGHIPQPYIFYSQGINLANNDTAAWLKSTEYYITALRNRYGYMPVFTTVLPTSSAGVVFNNTINKMAYWDGFTWVVRTSDLGQQDPAHWSASGLDSLADRMISLSVDTVMQRDKYVQSQANHLKRGYLNATLLAVDQDIDADGFIDVGTGAMRLKSNSSNSFIGLGSGAAITSGTGNSSLGYLSLSTLTTGTENTALGYQALKVTTSGVSNTAIGSQALQVNSSGSYNVGIGQFCLANINANHNIGIGYYAGGPLNSGSYNVAIGSQVLSNTNQSNQSVDIGYNAMRGNTGDNNVAIGYQAGGISTVTRSGCIFIGANSGDAETASNKLAIDNSNTNQPLLHGDFTNDSLKVNGYFKVRDSINVTRTRIGASTDSVLVKLSNNTFGAVAQSSIAGAVTTLYTGDGSLSGDRTVTGGANGLTFTSTRTSTNSTITVNNTSSGRGINVSSGAGVGVRSVGTTGIALQGISTDNYGLWAQSTTAPGLYVLTSAAHAADLTTNPSSTNTVVPIINAYRTSQSAGANGIGGSIDIYLNNSSGAGTTVLANQIISKLPTATSTAEVSQLIIKGVNAGSPTTIGIFDGDGTFTTTGRRKIKTVTDGGATLLIGNAQGYFFNGTTATWTLPAVAGTDGIMYIIKNIGSGTITLNADSGNNEIYNTSAVNTFSITSGQSYTLISNGTYWTIN
jgi:hypothetical protein